MTHNDVAAATAFPVGFSPVIWSDKKHKTAVGAPKRLEETNVDTR
jgi:hypothetical protein